MKLLDIGEVSERTGLPASTLRYYEEIKLISSAGRRGLRRQFLPETLKQISLISLGKVAGFSLEEIAGMFGAHGEPAVPRAELRRRADELARQVRQLSFLRVMIQHVADCRAPSHMECPQFRRLINLAVRHQKRKVR